MSSEDFEELKKVRQITDMGISEEEAAGALKITHGNVESALELIFQGDDTSQKPQDAPAYEQGNYEYPVEQVNFDYPLEEKNSAQIEPGILQDRLPPSYGPEAIPPPVPARDNQYNSIHIENADYSNSQLSLSDSGYLPDNEANRLHQYNREQQIRQEYSIYNDASKFQRSGRAPPLLMPVKNGYFESYLNPLLTILHEIPSFRKAVYQLQFETLGFHPRWYRGEAINIPEGVTSIVKDGHKVDLHLLLEVQRIFAFLDGDSSRSFASILNFVKAFPKDAQKEIHVATGLSEAYEVFYKTLSEQLEAAGIENPLKFFESKLLNDENGEERSFGMFNVEAEELKGDLYKTIHNLFWGEDLENTEHNLTSVADVVTVCFDPSFDHAPFGIEIPEVFYPQVYTTEFKETIDGLIKEKEKAEIERREIAKELMNLRVHQGKNVSALLDTTVEFISSEVELNKDDTELSDALKDLESIQSSNKKKIGELLQKQDLISEKKASRDPYNVKTILEHHEGSKPEPYLLTGVIKNDKRFIFLKKQQDSVEIKKPRWFHISYDPTTSNNLVLRNSRFESIKRSIYSSTRTQFDASIVLVYVKESTWNSKSEYERAESVEQFIQKDVEELNKSLELLVSSSGEESDDSFSNIEEDERVENAENNTEHVDYVELDITPEETNDEESGKENKENFHPNNPFR